MVPSPVLDEVAASSVRLALLWARTEIERQAPGYPVFVWYADKQPQPNCNHVVYQKRFELSNPKGILPRTWHYEFVLLDNKASSAKISGWGGERDYENIAYSDGARWDGNDLYFPPRPEYLKKGNTDVNPAEWMTELRGHLPGHTKLSALTIPGTHNSFARPKTVEEQTFFSDNAARMAECQGSTIANQLSMGIRFFDFRTDGEALRLRHGRVGLQGDLKPCLDEINGFLDAHPSETIIVSIKRDNQDYTTGNDHPETPETRKAIEDCFDQYTARKYTERTVPTLDQCCGKMILLSGKCSTKGMSMGDVEKAGAPEVGWDSDDYEDHFQRVKARAAWNASQSPTDDGFFYDIWTNAYFCPWDRFIKNTFKSPKDHTDNGHAPASDLVSHQFWQQPTRLGVFAVDFAYPYLTKQLILTNLSST